MPDSIFYVSYGMRDDLFRGFFVFLGVVIAVFLNIEEMNSVVSS